MTASSVASESAKVFRIEIEQLARSLGIDPVGGLSSAALFRRCVQKAAEDRQRLTTQARAGAAELIGILGGDGEEATAAREGTPAERDAC